MTRSHCWNTLLRHCERMSLLEHSITTICTEVIIGSRSRNNYIVLHHSNNYLGYNFYLRYLFAFVMFLVALMTSSQLRGAKNSIRISVYPKQYLSNSVPSWVWLPIRFHHHWLDSPTWALAFLRSFCQLKYPAIASSDFATRVFSRVRLSAPRSTHGCPGGPMFSVRVVSLSRLVPILKSQDLASALAYLGV
jgi:hypothetical protein